MSDAVAQLRCSIRDICYGALLCASLIGLAAPTKAQAPMACDAWIEARPKGNWQNSSALTDDFRQASRDCIRELESLDTEQRLALLDEYLFEAFNFINPNDLRAASERWSEAAKLKVHAIRVPFIFSPFLTDQDQIDDWLIQARDLGDQKARARFAFYLALRQFHTDDPESADNSIDELLTESAEAGKIAGGMRIGLLALNTQAMLAKRSGEIARAVDLLRDVIANSEGERLELAHMESLGDLAYLFHELGEYDRAVSLFNRALAHSDRHPLTSAQIEINRALALKELPDLEAAEAGMKRALRAFEQNAEQGSTEQSILPGVYDARFELARIQFLQGSRDPSVVLEEAEVAARALHKADYFDDVVHAEAFAWIAEQRLSLGRIAEAEQLLALAKDTYGQEINPNDATVADQDRNFLLPYSRTMANLMTQLGRYEEANNYASMAMKVSEDRFQEEKLRAAGNADLFFALQDEEQRAKRAETERNYLAASAQRDRIIALLGVLLALALIVVAFALYRAYRSQRAAADTSKLFFREMHHRVANNLQLLLSLFRIDARKQEKADVDGASLRSAAVLRLKTMALIHERLRAREGGTTVDSGEFFGELDLMLRESGLTQDIEFTGHYESAPLDVEVAIPLGLLVSELATNAYKHAFSSNESASLEMTFVTRQDHGTLTMRDNGKGLGQSKVIGADGHKGLGLVTDLAEQLGAEISLDSPPEGTGCVWTITDIKLSDGERLLVLSE